MNTTPVTGNTIVGSTTGFWVGNNSFLDLRQSTVTAPKNEVSRGSMLRIGNDYFGGDPSNITVTGDVAANGSSSMHINTAANMNGLVSCESFSTLDNHGLGGTGSVNCPYVIVTGISDI